MTILIQDVPLPLLALIGVTIVMAAWGLWELVRGTDTVRRRLEGPAEAVSAATGRERLFARLGARSKALRGVSALLPANDDPRTSRLRQRMVQAGFERPDALEIAFALRFGLGLGLPLALSLALSWRSAPLASNTTALVLFGAALMGVYGPAAWIARRRRQRQERFTEGFPDALDMLLTCVEAGLGLDAAIGRVADEMTRGHPRVAEQFRLVGLELRAGATRSQALRNMAARIGTEEVRSLTTLLVQSESLGTSLGDSLRVHAEEMRQRRLMNAEEKAAALPVKLTVPLVLGILPALLAVLLAPGLIRLIRSLIPILHGG